MATLEPRLSQFGPALGWLLARGVSSSRLAALFGTTAQNVRVIAFRGRHENRAQTSYGAQLGRDPEPGLAKTLGVRTAPDEVVRTPFKTRNLEQLRNELDRIVTRCSEQYEFLNGVRELQRMLPKMGYAGDSRRIALRALAHQKIAWFLVHSGRCASAADYSHVASELWRIAYHETGSPDYAEGFIQSALIGSQAWLLARRPQEAWLVLDLARDAAESIGVPLGSDHARQRGVALLQLREDQQAQKQFQKSAELMEKLNEATVSAQIVMTGTRHAGLLTLNCDQGRDVLEIARRAFGEGSLEASMALHWSAAAGLSTDSPMTIANAADLLNRHPEPAPQFGHQATIRKLLSIAPELGLDLRLRRAWVRRALYENAFRSR